MKTNTIKGKLLLLVLISTLLSFVILGVYTTFQSYSKESVLVEKKAISLAADTSKFINSYFQSKINILEALSEEITDIQINSSNEKLTDKLMLAKKSGKFVDVYFGFDDDGSIVLSSKRVLSKEKDNYDARTRPWYKDAVSRKKSGISNPYIDTETKKMVVSIYTPFIKDNQLIGVIGSDIFIDTIVSSVLNIDLETKGSTYIVDRQEKVIIHNNEELLNKEDKTLANLSVENNLGFAQTVVDGIEYLVSYGSIQTADWKTIIKLEKDSVYEQSNKNMIKQIIIYIVLLVIILTLLFFALTKLLAPLHDLQNGFNYFFRYLKNEEKNVSQININTNDEFGAMAKVINSEMKSVSETINSDRALIEEVKTILNSVKEGYLENKITKSTTTDSLNELKELLNEMLENLKVNIGRDINIILESLAHYSELDFRENIPNAQGKVSLAINDLSNIINDMLKENKQNGLTLENSSNVLLENVDTLNRNSTETAAALEETAAALEQITSTIVSNTENIAKMSTYSKDVSKSVQTGQELATNTVKAMDEINEQAQAIADAITVIDQIAFQTNILSLNAAVEAATAGEAGKGFAVVAQEVRNLASRSAEAAKEIKSLVENATQKTNAGKDGADKMIEGYHSLNESIQKTTDIIGHIAEAAQEQRHGIEQINDAVNQLDKQTQENVAISNTTHHIAEQTDNIAKLIVSSADKKEFNGKDTVKAKEFTQESESKFELKRKENSKLGKNSKPTLKLEESENNDEWESF